ncbi:MAG TPA: hypothetical protein VJU60_03470 [Thermoleophilaceae bacterium]|nr:hypothetical protein [Thermoleophilaceae bacterium]
MLATAVAAALALPAAANADVTVTGFSVTPSTTAAGAHPDVVVNEQFSYGSSTTDSVKTTTLHFPAGLLGNPQATALCPEANFEADTCPANTQVGETTVGTLVYAAPSPIPPLTINAPGSIYNLVPDGIHPAVLGIVVRPGMGAPNIFLKSPVSLRTSGDFGIDSPVDNQPNSTTLGPLTPGVQITSTQLTLYGTRPGMAAPFMTNPTSCKPATTNFDAVSHEAPSKTATASSTFTPTDCDKEPFAPKLTATMGAPGATAKNSHVPFVATITQAPGESAQLATAVTLPASLASGVSAVAGLCTADQLAAAACPANARLGTATIASPLLPNAVQGPVFAILRPGQLPGVGVEFGGVLPFVLSGNSGLAGGRLQNVFSGLPDVPLTSFSLAIDGGPHGLLVATRDICSGPAPTVDGAFTGQNGATTTASAPVTVVGCGAPRLKSPHAKVTARGLRGRHPRLQITVLKGAAKLRTVTVTLPRSIVVGKSRHGLSATGARFKLSKKKLTLSRKGRLTLRLPSHGASRVTAKLSGSVIHASKGLKKKLRRHRTAKLKLTVRTVDTSGRRATLHVKFTGHR